MRKLTFLLILMVSFCASSQIPTSGLIGSWPFTGNADDATAFGNNGVVSGATLTTDRFGSPNSAYSFDGIDDQIQIPAASQLYRYNTSFTISAWVRQTATPPGFSQPIFTNRTNTAGSEFSIDGAGNNIGTEGFLAFVTYNGTYGICRSTNMVPINNGYQHVVVVFTYYGSNNNTVKVYVNGALNNTESGIINIPYSTEDTYIGWGPNFTQTNRHFDGDIDDIFLYDRALTDSEIGGLFNANAGIQEHIHAKFKVFPNPSSDFLNVIVENEYVSSFSIYSYDGKLYKQEIFSEQINIEELPRGTYQIVFFDKENKTISINSFIKE
jgi:Concanavalin A-like lectin/glucanases superfamily/Secretion system C-terminal sorting domain